MFVRWKTTQTREEKWFNRGDGLYYRAYLIESVRINGKPRQKQHYLAAIREGHLDKTYDRAIFWQNTWENLDPLHLSEEQQNAITSALEKRVPVPEWEEVDKYKHDAYMIQSLTWEELEEKAEEAFVRAHPEMADKEDLWYWRSGMWENIKAQRKRSADKNESLENVGTTAEETP